VDSMVNREVKLRPERVDLRSVSEVVYPWRWNVGWVRLVSCGVK